MTVRVASMSAVIPVFNAESILPRLVERLVSVLSACAEHFEIILVNDGSRDRSWAVIAELAQQHPRVRGLDLQRNVGQQNALLAGIRVARGEIVVTLDDDGQTRRRRSHACWPLWLTGSTSCTGPPRPRVTVSGATWLRGSRS